MEGGRKEEGKRGGGEKGRRGGGGKVAGRTVKLGMNYQILQHSMPKPHTHYGPMKFQ